MDIKNSVYTMADIQLWAEKYKELKTFADVARYFNVCRDTVRVWLVKYKDSFGLTFHQDMYGLETEITKVCTKCGKEKDKSEFIKSKGKLRSECKVCCNKRRSPKVYEELERNKNGLKTCTGKNGCGKVKPLNEFYEYPKNKIHGRSSHCKECEKIYDLKRIENKNIPEITEKRCVGKYGCGQIKSINNFYYVKAKKSYLAFCKSCWSKRFRSRINAKLAGLLRSRMGHAIKNIQKSGSAVSDLGCSIDELKIYLEARFYPNPETGEMMTWESWAYKGWHIDHIKPLASFNLQDREQFLQACHYTNLQPMWAKENFSKSAKISKEFGNDC